MGDPRRSVVHWYRNEAWDINAFTRLLEEIGDLDRVQGAKTIIVKPNLCAGTLFGPESGVVSAFWSLESVLGFLRLLNPSSRIVVAESDSIGFGFAYAKMDRQGYERLVTRHNVELYDLSRSRLSSFRPARPLRFFDGIWLSEVFASSDYFISLGKIKTHNMTTVSISMKNLFGCLPDSDKSKHHPWIDQTVVDIVQAIRPDLEIADSSPALEGNGPVHGKPVALDYILAGNDPVAVDAIGARALGFDPRGIGHIRLAEEAGVGRIEPDVLRLPEGVGLEDIVGRRVEYIGWQQRLLCRLGLRIQGWGQRLAALGHLLHLAPSFPFIASRAWRRAWRALVSSVRRAH